MPASSETRRWKKKQKRDPQIDEEDDDEDLEDEDQPRRNPSPDPVPLEVLSNTGVRLSDFPIVVRQTVNRHHPSVLAVVAAERAGRRGEAGEGRSGVGIENLSHGQLQTVSAVPRDCPSLLAAGEAERADGAAGFVVTPPKIVEGRGVVKRFGDRVHVVPMHADWFSPNTVHRLERQVVPHFFTGKSAENTHEKYMECRNRIVAKYMENPEIRLTLDGCQGLVTGFSLDDLSRVVRFLDHWGIINYCASVFNNEPQLDDSFLREDSNGEVHVPSTSLKSIDSLIQFDKPKCKVKAAYIYPSLLCHEEEPDLDSTIREHLSEKKCNYCSRSVPVVYYQSQKEVDTLLCVDCFNDGRFVIGHSSMDFVRVDTSRDYGDMDGESWTNQETILLLEAVETYKDKWNEIAEYVGSKSKAQCILHFIRLPSDDGPVENFEVPSTSLSSNGSKNDLFVRPHSSSNGDSAGSCDRGPDSESELPFANSANPVMALVAFLASAVGPRVAAACAHASLSVLSDDSKSDAEGMPNIEGYCHGDYRKSDGKSDLRGSENGEVIQLSADKVKSAAKAGLAAAATKAKLFADHEEREIQRLSANIINHQLKRLELKLKQFAEIEQMLMKECDQVERMRQRLAAERARLLSPHFGNSPETSSMNQSSIANNPMTNRQSMVTAPPQPFVTCGYNNNQPIHHQFLGRQQMYGLGPRLPLSALHPSSSGNAQHSPSHSMLRSVSGGSSSLG